MRIGRFLRHLHRAIQEQGLIQPGQGVVVAVSGGPDSTALLTGLAGLNLAYGTGFRLYVAHLNHRIRGTESDADAAFVEAQARRLGLAATIESADIPARTGPAGGGLEQAGRKARYAFLARVARANDCPYVATAHHADDNAETILQRIIRGTGPRGLAGIPASRPLAADAVLADGRRILLVRPLLGFRRRLIRRVLADSQIPFRIDASNLAPDPTRNWLRNVLIPLLAKQANPGVVGALLRLGELSGWVNAFVEGTASRVLASLTIERTDRELSLNAGGLANKDPILQSELIRQAILAFGGGEVELGLRHLKAVMRIAGAAEAGKTVHLPGRIVAQRRGEILLLRREPAGPPGAAVPGRDLAPGPARPPGESPGAAELAAPYDAERGGGVVVQVPGGTPLPLRRAQLLVELVENRPGLLAEFRAARTGQSELIDLDRVRPPLVVRSRRPGDRFWPLGAPGSKKIGDFLSDCKVPPTERDRVCLLCDQLGPVWVMPYRIDERVRVRESSRNLAALKLEPLGESAV